MGPLSVPAPFPPVLGARMERCIRVQTILQNEGENNDQNYDKN